MDINSQDKKPKGIQEYNNSNYSKIDKFNIENNKVPIYKGCPNKNNQCFCTGVCKEIIGYRDKLPNEN